MVKNLKKLLIFAAALCFAYWFIAIIIFGRSIVDSSLDGIDGPYVINGQVYQVTAENQLKSYPLDSNQSILVQVNNHDLDTFSVQLQKELEAQPETYAMPEKLVAISDIEGNFNGFYAFLIKNQIMDKEYRWTFGKAHLILNGDFVDRGNHVTAVLWLIYHLEQQARLAGGKVHYILGNHEILNMYGNTSYAQPKYLEIAKRISKETDLIKANQYIYGGKSVIGRWLRTKNIMEKIGDYVFVHAGLNKALVDEGLTQNGINAIAKQYYGRNPEPDSLDKSEFLILKSNNSPCWDRTLSMNIFYKIQYFYRAPFKSIPTAQSQEDLNKVLNYYKASRIVIGHSIVSDIETDYENRVIKIDLKHGQGKYSGETKGLLIHKGQLFKLDDLGNKIKMTLKKNRIPKNAAFVINI